MYQNEDDFDYCALVRGIAADPLAKVPGLTVRRMFGLRAHVACCDPCSDLVDAVHQRYPAKNSGFYQSESN